MGRPVLPPEEKKILFNAKLSPDVFARLKLICFRRSVHDLKKFSEGQFISSQIVGTKLPPPPSPAAIAAYVKMYPQHTETVKEMLKLRP